MKSDFPKIGDTLIFKGVPEFYYPNFTNLKVDAEKYLVVDQEYEIKNVIVNSSWCSVYLKGVENPSVGYNLSFFEMGSGAYSVKSTSSDKKKLKRCENCNHLVDIANEDGHAKNCDFVWGRRGWRQLGAYEG